jgi:hypothetical protein
MLNPFAQVVDVTIDLSMQTLGRMLEPMLLSYQHLKEIPYGQNIRRIISAGSQKFRHARKEGAFRISSRRLPAPNPFSREAGRFCEPVAAGRTI